MFYLPGYQLNSEELKPLKRNVLQTLHWLHSPVIELKRCVNRLRNSKMPVLGLNWAFNIYINLKAAFRQLCKDTCHFWYLCVGWKYRSWLVLTVLQPDELTPLCTQWNRISVFSCHNGRNADKDKTLNNHQAGLRILWRKVTFSGSGSLAITDIYSKAVNSSKCHLQQQSLSHHNSPCHAVWFCYDTIFRYFGQRLQWFVLLSIYILYAFISVFISLSSSFVPLRSVMASVFTIPAKSPLSTLSLTLSCHRFLSPMLNVSSVEGFIIGLFPRWKWTW